MDVFDPTCIYNLFTTDYRALDISNDKPKLCHSAVILSPSIKPHIGILIQVDILNSVTCKKTQIALYSLPWSKGYCEECPRQTACYKLFKLHMVINPLAHWDEGHATGMCLYGIWTPSIATNAPPWTRSSWSDSPADLTFGSNQIVYLQDMNRMSSKSWRKNLAILQT